MLDIESNEIQTLPPLPKVVAEKSYISEMTGEPVRTVVPMVSIIGLTIACVAGTVPMLRSLWLTVDHWASSAWFIAQTKPIAGSVWSVLSVFAIAAIGLTMCVGAGATAFQVWRGHRWARIGGLIATAFSLSGLLLSKWSIPAIVLTLLFTTLLWLPPCSRYFATWDRYREPKHQDQTSNENVFYGPLPRYVS
ncbi:MAG: hypothetical protein CSA63_01675 [Propionibacterium sp.]|nr:MAG: hypothetical protein CSA63_01675 [Propionibacterium sp.]